MLRVIPFQTEHLAKITGKKEILADLDHVMSQGLAAEYLTRGPAYTIVYANQIVWCGGVVILWPGVAEAWAVPSMSLADCPVAFHRDVKIVLGQLIETMQLRRVQCTVHNLFRSSRKWLEKLGFHFEGEMPKYGPDGSDHYRYAWVKK
jgi:hypothetical protein